jgi:hypothetical protein
MRDVNRRLEALELAAERRHMARFLPPGLTLERFLNAMIAFLELPLKDRQEQMPMFTEDEHNQMPAWLPRYRRIRMRVLHDR